MGAAFFLPGRLEVVSGLVVFSFLPHRAINGGPGLFNLGDLIHVFIAAVHQDRGRLIHLLGHAFEVGAKLVAIRCTLTHPRPQH